MKATLDTNVIIHIYEADLEDALHSNFEQIYVYEFIIEKELKTHASPAVIAAVKDDISKGKIVLVTKSDLLEKGSTKCVNGAVGYKFNYRTCCIYTNEEIQTMEHQTSNLESKTIIG